MAKILIDLRQRLTKNDSVTLAKGLVKELRGSMRLLRNNHRGSGFAVLKAPDTPSVLIEMGYLSNIQDERLKVSKTPVPTKMQYAKRKRRGTTPQLNTIEMVIT